MKVLIVEDDLTSMLLLKRILRPLGYQVTGATNGEEAVGILLDNEFDIVLTDWMMPLMDGVQLIRRIRTMHRPAPIILMITAVNSPQARAMAIEAGADGYLAKPVRGDDILIAIRNEVDKRTQKNPIVVVPEPPRPVARPPFTGVGIATSTGGPSSVRTLFRGLGHNRDACFLLVQHGPAWMLESFVSRLQEDTPLTVRLGIHGMPIAPGEIYIAPGEKHMVVDAETFRIQLTDDPPENFVRPAADPLFRSIATAFGERSVVVVMTGMGRDGTVGSAFVKAAGGAVIAQDPSTAVISNMPQSVIEMHLVSIVAPLDELAGELNRAVHAKSQPARHSTSFVH